MGLQNVIEKLDKYFKRLETQKAQRIKPSHVARVIEKLDIKADQLRGEIAAAGKSSARDRLARKLDLVQEQKQRALWLQGQIKDK